MGFKAKPLGRKVSAQNGPADELSELYSAMTGGNIHMAAAEQIGK